MAGGTVAYSNTPFTLDFDKYIFKYTPGQSLSFDTSAGEFKITIDGQGIHLNNDLVVDFVKTKSIYNTSQEPTIHGYSLSSTLSNQVTALEKENKELKEKVNSLEERLNKLESLISQ